MPDPISAIATIGSQVIGSSMAGDATEDAANIQAGATREGIEEQRRQFDQMRTLLQPFVQSGQNAMGMLSPFQQAGAPALAGLQPFAQAGAPALQQQQAIAGLLGPQAQAQAIQGIESGGLFQSLARQGENAMLQNASATGGLRGGNVQGAMAQFRPQLLQQLIDQQYSRLGGLANTGLSTNQNIANMGLSTNQNLAQLGQSSAAGVGAAGLQSANQVSNLLGQQGAAQAQGVLSGAQAGIGGLSGLTQGLTAYTKATGSSPFAGLSGSSSPSNAQLEQMYLM
jgi:hypothetical protein